MWRAMMMCVIVGAALGILIVAIFPKFLYMQNTLVLGGGVLGFIAYVSGLYKIGESQFSQPKGGWL